jgi:hypothetical protein
LKDTFTHESSICCLQDAESILYVGSEPFSDEHKYCRSVPEGVFDSDAECGNAKKLKTGQLAVDSTNKLIVRSQ